MYRMSESISTRRRKGGSVRFYFAYSKSSAATTPLRSPALSIPPRNTTPIAENKQLLSSGTTLNSKKPLSPGNSTLVAPPSPPALGVVAWDTGCGVNRDGAESASLVALIDGAGVVILDGIGAVT